MHLSAFSKINEESVSETEICTTLSFLLNTSLLYNRVTESAITSKLTNYLAESCFRLTLTFRSLISLAVRSSSISDTIFMTIYGHVCCTAVKNRKAISRIAPTGKKQVTSFFYSREQRIGVSELDYYRRPSS